MKTETPWKKLEDGTVEGSWWHVDPAKGRIVCDLCPRECHLKPGDRGFCFVRENRDQRMVLSTYGRSTGFCIDPIEKKPLNHFFPGTSVLSFGTAGCNLGCQFCQNWDISKSREVERLSEYATPEMIVQAALQYGCKSVAYTYNDPIVWAEYAIDTAHACRSLGIQNVAVTAGYIHPNARTHFFSAMDAANVDLKGFSEEFYSKITYSHLDPVLDTLVYLKKETEVWFEITNLVIPQLNDDRDELKRMSDWIVKHLGVDVPVHFSAFHPDFRMRDRPRTPVETLIAAHEIASQAGIRYAYVGNVHDKERQSTHCPNCRVCLIERDWYQLGRYGLDGNRCRGCGSAIAGKFDSAPGTWGPRREPVRIQSFAKTGKQEDAGPQDVLPSPATLSTTSPSSSSISSRNQTMSAIDPPTILDMEQLDEKEQQSILRMASRLVSAAVLGRSVPRNGLEAMGDLAQSRVMGLFVTLKRGQQLRGCCGLLGQPIPLIEALVHASHRTAKEDTRLPAISPSELPYLRLDVTLLAACEAMHGSGEALLDQFILGSHGLRMSLGDRAGLLLPSVPLEQGWDKRQFLEGLCRKAGLPENAWRDPKAKLERFAGKLMEGHLDPEDYGSSTPRARPIVAANTIELLRSLVAQNILAFSRGATPTYTNPQLPDGNVHGLVLSIFNAKTKHALAHLVQMSLRPGIPLQSTMFELSKTAANVLAQSRPPQNMEIEIGLTVLHDPALHGCTFDGNAGEACEIEGIRSGERAVVAMMGGARIAVAFDPQKGTDTLLDEAFRSLSAKGRMVTVYSMEYASTQASLVASTAPAGQPGPGVRPPAVAGQFYPADDTERKKMVQGFLESSRAQEKREALALMSPHAGLRFSGQIAADVWSRVSIPKSVLIVGPKHTPDGVDWGISPHRRWQISLATEFPADLSLAQSIADNVTGMQLDAAAHRREHGIEVQLPFLEILAPETKVAAIAMSGGSWSELETAAKQLAMVLKNLEERPLLVISSDMNHFATDAESRKLDRMALDAFQTCDPKRLLDVCQQHRISMCGVIPAAFVLQTLIELGRPFEYQEVAYGTSADASGDTSRVVGYASVLLTEKGG